MTSDPPKRKRLEMSPAVRAMLEQWKGDAAKIAQDTSPAPSRPKAKTVMVATRDHDPPKEKESVQYIAHGRGRKPVHFAKPVVLKPKSLQVTDSMPPAPTLHGNPVEFLKGRGYEVWVMPDGKYKIDQRIYDRKGMLAIANRNARTIGKPEFE